MLKFTPYPFQRKSVKRAIRWRRRAIFGHQMGMGKSPMAMMTIEGVDGSTLILCPAIAKEHWKRECLNHFGKHAIVLSGRTPHPLPEGNIIVIANYEILGVPRRNKAQVWTTVLQKRKFKTVIFDEIHYLKEPRSQRSRACRVLIRGVPNRIGLSGTAIPNRPIELWHPISLIRPDMFPSRYFYALEYCAGHTGRFGFDDRGASNVEQLHEIITHPDTGVLIRQKKEDVLKDLPQKTRIIYPFELGQAQWREYQYAKNHFIQWLKEISVAKARRAARAEAILRFNYLKRLVAELKMDSVVEWIREFLESEEKLLVFGVHHRILDPLFEKFKQQAVLLTGKTQQKDRQKIIDKFNEDKRCRLFIGNIQAAGVAWSCKSSSNVAFAEMGWVPAEHLQAEDRCHGLSRGTGSPMNSYWLVAASTVEEKLCEILQRKALIASAALDGAPKAELAVFDLMLDAIENEPNTTAKLIVKSRNGVKSV